MLALRGGAVNTDKYASFVLSRPLRLRICRRKLLRPGGIQKSNISITTPIPCLQLRTTFSVERGEGRCREGWGWVHDSADSNITGQGKPHFGNDNKEMKQRLEQEGR